ncbi:ribonuclease III [Anaeroselena agilis]|uniref:Ribonuclease 3 n=1 Tax=Anaeroselena agilis TaxID=3063788 RepID=A0ABU3NWP5_9FIRM|nr:ribonuclease III [Selenomonadales bacterium 4137-cl]
MDSRQESDPPDDLGRALGIAFADPALLRQALVHTSFANERKTGHLAHNQRLEFLGDAVLDLVISEYLYRRFGSLPEGELTKARAALVCEPTLARRAKALGIGRHLLLGRGEAASGGRERDSILADAFEAIVGAVYLDRGFAAASECVLRLLAGELEAISGGDFGRDYKTILQEIAQKNGDVRISYEVIGESGPDHNKTFSVAVSVNNVLLGTGNGRSKKEAEQSAARRAVEQLGASD